MKKICFVILHYLDFQTTEKCIDSILFNIKYNNIQVVVVDNGSPNESGKKIQKKYQRYQNVTVLFSDINIGFANGNNIGYVYAREQLEADFIIITNNDTIYEDENFINKMISIFKKNKSYLIGPDIITPTGKHQNPHRKNILTKFEIYKSLFIKRGLYYYFNLKKFFHINDKIMLLEKIYDLKNLKNQNSKEYQYININGVLQGACIIYTPLYIAQEKKAFSSETFMYGEEDILSYYCFVKGYTTLYTPEIQVFHLNGETTEKVYKTSLEKRIFCYKHYIKGLKILLEKVKNRSENL